jgi:hypothetical protein|tara:strand:+ start:362 stop:577 length:216 start_codon:yes stop_codon:yes gene_type:complete
VDVGEQSVIFVEKQMETNFSQIMSQNIIKEMYWIDVSDGARAVAIMGEITDEKKIESNLICLFPIFKPKED